MKKFYYFLRNLSIYFQKIVSVIHNQIKSYNNFMNSFKIMSLNLLTSGANIPGNPPFNIRITAIKSMLEEYTPDIIGVQELTDSMFPYLKDILNKYAIFGESRHSLLSDEYSSILFNKDKYELIEGKTLWLSDTVTKKGSKYLLSQFPRIVTYVYLKDKLTNKTFTVFNTHLDANFPFIRTKQAIILSKIIHKYQQGDFTLLCGDFNCTRLSPALRILSKRLKDLSYDEMGSTLRGNVGSLLYKHLPIDHIFISDNLSIDEVNKITSSYNTIYPTDHYPVIANIYY